MDQGDQEVLKFEDWKARAVAKFGSNPLGWKFVCPSCGNEQTMQQFKDLGVDHNLAYFNCIGRHDGKHGGVELGTKPGPCNYTGGGLFNLNPIRVEHPESGDVLRVFDFAEV